tara:strand:+ start:11947 stop:12222 length:276 start_codon:yes stop_codon:yes gene_type:complete
MNDQLADALSDPNMKDSGVQIHFLDSEGSPTIYVDQVAWHGDNDCTIWGGLWVGGCVETRIRKNSDGRWTNDDGEIVELILPAQTMEEVSK